MIHFLQYALTATTLFLRLRLEGEVIQLCLILSDGQALFDGYVQFIHGLGTLVAVQNVGCAVVLQRLRRVQIMS